MSETGGPWTRHGHPIPGVTVYPESSADRPRSVARCGGTRLCKECQTDAAAVRPSGSASGGAA